MCRRTYEDEGFALVIVMTAIALITAVAIGGYALASSTLYDSTGNRSQNAAYQAASTGLETELPNFDPSMLGKYPVTQQVGDATYTVEVTPLGGESYRMRSTGVSRQNRNEVVFVDFRSMSLWDMNISGSEGGSFGARGFNGNATIFGTIYVQGPVVQGGNSKIYDGPVYFKPGPGDTWTVQGSPSIGSVNDPAVPVYGPVPSASGYNISRKGSAPDFTIPTISSSQLTEYQSMADRWGVTNMQTVGSSTGSFGGGAVTIVDRGDGRKIVEFHKSTNGELPVIYWGGPGDLTIDASVIGYTGVGMIVSATNVIISSDFVPFGPVTASNPTAYFSYLTDGSTLGPAVPGPADEQWVNPPIQDDTAMCGILTPGEVTMPQQTGTTGPGVAAAIMCNGQFNMGQNCKFRGSVISGFLNFDQNANKMYFANQTGLGTKIDGNMSGYMPALSAIIAQGDWVRQ